MDSEARLPGFESQLVSFFSLVIVLFHFTVKFLIYLELILVE